MVTIQIQLWYWQPYFSRYLWPSCLDSIIDALPTFASTSQGTQTPVFLCLCLHLSENTPNRQTHTYSHTPNRWQTRPHSYGNTTYGAPNIQTTQRNPERRMRRGTAMPMPIWIEKLNRLKPIKILDPWWPLILSHTANSVKNGGLGLQCWLSLTFSCQFCLQGRAHIAKCGNMLQRF